MVHRLVAEVFVSGRTADRRIINHRDGNKTNNNWWNLEWCTYSENALHAYDLGLWRKEGKLTVEQVMHIRTSEQTHAELGRLFGVSPTAILYVRQGKAYRRLARAA